MTILFPSEVWYTVATTEWRNFIMARRKNYINRTHILIEIAALVIWLASMILAAVGAVTLDGDVPTHFSNKGVADAFGAPSSLLITPVVLMVVLGPMSLVCHHFTPSLWKMPFNIKPERLDLVYTDITYLILILELIISIICLWMTVAGFRQGNVGIGFPIFTAVSIALDLIVWIAIAVRHNRM